MQQDKPAHDEHAYGQPWRGSRYTPASGYGSPCAQDFQSGLYQTPLMASTQHTFGMRQFETANDCGGEGSTLAAYPIP